jgi:hypothetical protein
VTTRRWKAQGGSRAREELLRGDAAHHVLGLRLNLFVAAGLTLAGAAWLVLTQRAGAYHGRGDAEHPALRARLGRLRR